jgi:hypothetical protein
MFRIKIGIISFLVRAVLGLKGFSTAIFVSNKNSTGSGLGLGSTSNHIKRGATIMYDSMTDTEEGVRPSIFWFDEVESTMVKARELIPDHREKSSFSVVAGHQSAGRGTRGRTWVSGSGNLFLTVALRLSSIPTPLTLIPLRVGTLIFPSIQSRVTSHAEVVLKWPNDVLIGNEKVCGVLIEIEGDFMLIGIGCNVMTAPTVENTGIDNGRSSTCLSKHMTICDNNDDHSGSKSMTCDNGLLGEVHKEIAAEIYGALSSLLLQPKDSAGKHFLLFFSSTFFFHFFLLLFFFFSYLFFSLVLLLGLPLLFPVLLFVVFLLLLFLCPNCTFLHYR